MTPNIVKVLMARGAKLTTCSWDSEVRRVIATGKKTAGFKCVMTRKMDQVPGSSFVGVWIGGRKGWEKKNRRKRFGGFLPGDLSSKSNVHEGGSWRNQSVHLLSLESALMEVYYRQRKKK